MVVRVRRELPVMRSGCTGQTSRVVVKPQMKVQASPGFRIDLASSSARFSATSSRARRCVMCLAKYWPPCRMT
jgi:hypothetical protein